MSIVYMTIIVYRYRLFADSINFDNFLSGLHVSVSHQDTVT